MHVYRWDLDKTYLQTDIDSMRGLMRSAVESASEKRNVPGSAALVRSLTRFDDKARVVILSGSPTQMRDVIEEKLALDGVRFDELVLKDNLRNIRRGRFRAVRNQVGYKLPNLLQMRMGTGKHVRETLFGDDSEVDALIYCLYADAVADRVSESELARVMESAGAYPDTVKSAVASLRRTARVDAVEDAFIHVGRGVSLNDFSLLGPLVTPIFSWFQAAVLLWKRERLGIAGVEDVVRAVDAQVALGEVAVASWLQDLVRRRLIEPDQVRELLAAAPALSSSRERTERAIDWLGPLPPPIAAPARADYLGFLKAVHREK